MNFQSQVSTYDWNERQCSFHTSPFLQYDFSALTIACHSKWNDGTGCWKIVCAENSYLVWPRTVYLLSNYVTTVYFPCMGHGSFFCQYYISIETLMHSNGVELKCVTVGEWSQNMVRTLLPGFSSFPDLHHLVQSLQHQIRVLL